MRGQPFHQNEGQISRVTGQGEEGMVASGTDTGQGWVDRRGVRECLRTSGWAYPLSNAWHMATST
jgi:hypothetical protein